MTDFDFFFSLPVSLDAFVFTPVPSNPEYSYCLKNLSNVIPVESLMNLENRAGNGYFHLGVFITSDGTCTYGFFSDYQSFSKIEIDEQATGKEHCAGDDITKLMDRNQWLKSSTWIFHH